MHESRTNWKLDEHSASCYSDGIFHRLPGTTLFQHAPGTPVDTGSCNRLSAAQYRFPEKRGCEIKMANGLLHDPCGRCPSWICAMMVTPFQPSPPRFFFCFDSMHVHWIVTPYLDWGIQSRTEHGEMGLYLNWIFKSTNPKNQPVIIHRGTTTTGVDCGGGR